MTLTPPHRLISSLLSKAGFSHGFFTRRGGVSAGSYASLNASFGVGDERDHVFENRRRIAASLRILPERLLLARQVHGRNVIVVSDAEHGTVANCEADAVLGAGVSDVACAVQTADCVPILLADPSTGTAAAVHAGWRGVEQDVVTATARQMAAHGSKPSNLVAAIGPHISLSAFEVGEEVAVALERVHAGPLAAVHRTQGHPPHVSLERIVRGQLARYGVPDEQIETVGGCTVADADGFFSYRRDGKHSGRQLSAIVPKRSQST